jgi:hypothetical protein
MSTWKQAAAFVTIVFVIVVIQSTLASPLIQLEDTLLQFGDYSNQQFDGNALIDGLFAQWFNMGLIAIFLLAAVVIARLVRRELTRQGRQP